MIKISVLFKDLFTEVKGKKNNQKGNFFTFRNTATSFYNNLS